MFCGLTAGLLSGLEILHGLLTGLARGLGLFDGGFQIVSHGGLGGLGEGLPGRRIFGLSGGLLECVGDPLVALLFGQFKGSGGLGGLAALRRVRCRLFKVVAFGGLPGTFEGSLLLAELPGSFHARLEGLLGFTASLLGLTDFSGDLPAFLSCAGCLLLGGLEITSEGFLGGVGQGAALAIILITHRLLDSLLYSFPGMLVCLGELLGSFPAEGTLSGFTGGLGQIVLAGCFHSAFQRLGGWLLAGTSRIRHFRMLELIGELQGLFLVLAGEAHSGACHGFGCGFKVFVAERVFCTTQVGKWDGGSVLLELLDIFKCVPGLRGELGHLLLLLAGGTVKFVGEVADGGLLPLVLGHLSKLFGGTLEFAVAGGLGRVLQGFADLLRKIGRSLFGLLDCISKAIGESFELLAGGLGKLLCGLLG